MAGDDIPDPPVPEPGAECHYCDYPDPVGGLSRYGREPDAVWVCAQCLSTHIIRARDQDRCSGASPVRQHYEVLQAINYGVNFQFSIMMVALQGIQATLDHLLQHLPPSPTPPPPEPTHD